MSVIGRLRSRRRPRRPPRLAADGRFSVIAGGPAVVVTGEVDIATAPALREGLMAQAGRSPLLVDLSRVTFIDSSGLAVLLGLQRHMAAGGGRMGIVAPSEPVRLLFDVTGVGETLGVFGTLEEALAG